MWIALLALFASVIGGNLRSNTTSLEHSEMLVLNKTQDYVSPDTWRTAAIKPWYRSAEEKEEAVRRGRGDF